MDYAHQLLVNMCFSILLMIVIALILIIIIDNAEYNKSINKNYVDDNEDTNKEVINVISEMSNEDLKEKNNI